MGLRQLYLVDSSVVLERTTGFQKYASEIFPCSRYSHWLGPRFLIPSRLNRCVDLIAQAAARTNEQNQETVEVMRTWIVGPQSLYPTFLC
jgi:hypothetical protein